VKTHIIKLLSSVNFNLSPSDKPFLDISTCH